MAPAVRRGSCYLLHAHTPCSNAYPETELHEMCLVLTDDTRLARPERLEEVEGVCRRWTCDRRWDKRKHKHARSDNVTVAVAVSTVAVVVRQLIRGNAIAHVVFVPWCDRKPRKGRPRGCVLTDVTKVRPATAQRRSGQAPG